MLSGGTAVREAWLGYTGSPPTPTMSLVVCVCVCASVHACTRACVFVFLGNFCLVQYLLLSSISSESLNHSTSVSTAYLSGIKSEAPGVGILD